MPVFLGILLEHKEVEQEVVIIDNDIANEQATPTGWKPGSLTSSTMIKKKSLKQLKKGRYEDHRLGKEKQAG